MWKIYIGPNIKEEKFRCCSWIVRLLLRLLTCELETRGREVSGSGQASVLAQRRTAPVHVLVLQSSGRGLVLQTGELVLPVDTDGRLILFKLICVSTTFLSPYFLESVPCERVAGALKTWTAVQRITFTTTVFLGSRTHGSRILLSLIKLTFGTIWTF